MEFSGKKEIEVLIISDIHLGTMASNAALLLEYLKNISPKILVLNGDIIDTWRFSKNYFPKSHLRVIRYFIRLMEKGTKIYYITGNHDEIFRKFAHTRTGKFKIINQLTLKLNGEKIWILHGDLFDPVVRNWKWLSRLGAAAYGFISLLNLAMNLVLKEPASGKKVRLYKTSKRTPGFNTQNISGFEKRVAAEAIKRGARTVICGHTHIPAEKKVSLDTETVNYLNSGDWVENNSALEYNNGQWKLVFFHSKQIEEPKIQGEFNQTNPKITYSVGLN